MASDGIGLQPAMQLPEPDVMLMMVGVLVRPASRTSWTAAGN